MSARQQQFPAALLWSVLCPLRLRVSPPSLLSGSGSRVSSPALGLGSRVSSPAPGLLSSAPCSAVCRCGSTSLSRFSSGLKLRCSGSRSCWVPSVLLRPKSRLQVWSPVSVGSHRVLHRSPLTAPVANRTLDPVLRLLVLVHLRPLSFLKVLDPVPSVRHGLECGGPGPAVSHLCWTHDGSTGRTGRSR